MNDDSEYIINDSSILSGRDRKNSVDWRKPYDFLVEEEYSFSGNIEDIAIIFLTNHECPFHCLMCDLWKNTTDKPVPVGAIPGQIEWALKKLSPAKHLKLYNSGSFFDELAIPQDDYSKIATLVKDFDTVIVESHTKLINEKSLRFRDMLKPELEVAIGLEIAHPEILRKLNKQMTLDDFNNSVQFLTSNGIRSRAFILLRPPFLTEDEGIYWAKKSIDFAFDAGVECCVVIPTRAGTSAMKRLMDNGVFSPPNIQSLETVLEYGIGLNKGRVFADSWDLGLFSNCKECLTIRTNRIISMNLNQRIEERIECTCNFNDLKS